MRIVIGWAFFALFLGTCLFLNISDEPARHPGYNTVQPFPGTNAEGRVYRSSNSGSARVHALGVAKCFSDFAAGGDPVNTCYSRLPDAHRRAWRSSNQEVREMMLDMDLRLMNVERAYEFNMDTQKLSEVRGSEQREEIRQIALMMAETYRNAAKMVR